MELCICRISQAKGAVCPPGTEAPLSGGMILPERGAFAHIQCVGDQNAGTTAPANCSVM